MWAWMWKSVISIPVAFKSLQEYSHVAVYVRYNGENTAVWIQCKGMKHPFTVEQIL